MVPREQIWWAYKMILGREPESEHIYADYGNCSDVEQLRKILISSEEGCQRLRQDLQHAAAQLPFEFFRSMCVYIHIEKTGGTSVYESLAPGFSHGRVSLPHVSDICSYSVAELNQYDFVSGHMTFGEALALPRSSKLLMMTFRNPIDRLISFYRFHRSHPQSARDNVMVALAHDLSPREFFSHDYVRNDARVDNQYLRVLVDLPRELDKDGAAQYMPLALERLHSVDAIGITEQLSVSIETFCSRAKITFPDAIKFSHVTDDLIFGGAGFTSVDSVEKTDALEDEIAPLIIYDKVIYDHALCLFHSQSVN